MHSALLDTVSKRDGLHVVWCGVEASPKPSWIRTIAQTLTEDGPVVVVDFCGIVPQIGNNNTSLFDGRLHQGSPDRKDDHTYRWEDGIHILPTGHPHFPKALELPRLRNLLINLHLLREQFRHALLLLPKEWNESFDRIAGAASSWTILVDDHNLEHVLATVQQCQFGRKIPILWIGSWGLPSDMKRLGVVPFFRSENGDAPEGIALQMKESRRLHVLEQNPPEPWIWFLQRFWWFVGLVAAAIMFSVPMSLDTPQSLFKDLAAEKRLYSGKPYFQFRFNGGETVQRLAKHAIGRFTGLVAAESEVHDYIVETLKENHQDSSSWKRDPGGAMVPPDGVTLRFYPPAQLFNPEADSLMPAWRFFVSMLSDSLGYVTEYYNPSGIGGRRHMGIDIAGRKGTRILAPFSGKAWTTYDERGGVVIALVHDKDVLLFMHCDQLLYMDGQEVVQGDPLATVGMTGHTTGPHVHFVAGKASSNGASVAGPVKYNAVDPVKWTYDSAIKLREN